MSELEKIGMPSPYADIEHLRSQLEKAKAFITDWLAFEKSCVEKDGPYVSSKIPNLMKRAECVLKDLTQKGPSDE